MQKLFIVFIFIVNYVAAQINPAGMFEGIMKADGPLAPGYPDSCNAKVWVYYSTTDNHFYSGDSSCYRNTFPIGGDGYILDFCSNSNSLFNVNPTCSTAYPTDQVNTIVYYTNDSIYAEKRMFPSCGIFNTCKYYRFRGKRISTLQSHIGIKENDLNSYVSIYPNPVVQHTIYLNAYTEFDKIELRDLLGKQIEFQKEKTENGYTLNFSGELNSGIYFLQLSKGKQSVTKKVLVQKE